MRAALTTWLAPALLAPTLLALTLAGCAKDAEPPQAVQAKAQFQERAHLEEPLAAQGGAKADPDADGDEGKDRLKASSARGPAAANKLNLALEEPEPEPVAAPEPPPPPAAPAKPKPVLRRMREQSKTKEAKTAEAPPGGTEDDGKLDTLRAPAKQAARAFDRQAAPEQPAEVVDELVVEEDEEEKAELQVRSEITALPALDAPADDVAPLDDLLDASELAQGGDQGGEAIDPGVFSLDARRGPAKNQPGLFGNVRRAGLGLRPGDTLLTVDGVPAQRYAWRSNGAPPVLEVERDGRRVVLYPDGQASDDGAWAQGPRPARFLPRVGYFENTYLGRSPEYLRQVRRLDAAFGGPAPYAAAALPPQALDAPDDAGLALTATLDRPSLEQPHRVFLQVALKGSERFGWRRPPLDLTLVVDAGLAAGEPEVLTQAVTGLLRRLDPRDRLGVVVAQPGGPKVLSEVAELREARRALTRTLVDGVALQPSADPAPLAAALDRAGKLLRDAAQGQDRVPGSQTVVLLTRGGDDGRVQAAARVAHQLTLQGAVTSVIDLTDTGDLWWQVAQAGHGHDHRGRALGEALDAELASLAKVIARLLRINVRLAPDVRAVRILGVKGRAT